LLDIDGYLERINYYGSLVPNAETLRDLQVAHLLAVPFENLSIHAGEPIILENTALFEKIVERRRGGFCYELNGLFASLLSALGFEVVMLSAEVATNAGGFGPNFDHMTLMVVLEDRWLVDVGFGDSFREPLLIDDRSEQVQNERIYRIDSDGPYLLVLQRINGEGNQEWKTEYRFTLTPHQYPDYAEMCQYHQTSPESHFTRGRLCSKATPDGRLTLSDMKFITTTRSGLRQERLLSNQEQYDQTLRDSFGIIMG